MANLDDVKYFDITPVLSEKTAVFPGDTAFKNTVALDFSKGNNLKLSQIETTVHIGAHADAPNHYHKDGVGIDQRDLSIYMGSCQVIEVNCLPGHRILPTDFSLEKICTKRILFKTNSFPDPNNWNNDFNSLDPSTISALSDKGVILVGIDTPSVDPADDKELLSHNVIYKNDMAILEGIVLTNVEVGTYQLIALPLPLKNLDASPVRAVLIKD